MDPIDFLNLANEKFRKEGLDLSIHEGGRVSLLFAHEFREGFMHRGAVGSIFFEKGKFSCKVIHECFSQVMIILSSIQSDFKVAISLSEEKGKIIK